MTSRSEIVTRLELPLIVPFDASDWTTVGQIVRRNVQEGVDAQTDVRGLPYPPLKPNTIASKTEKGSVEPTKRLIDTGNLRANQTVEVVANGVDVFVGPTRAREALFMQQGTVPHEIVAKKAPLLSFVTIEGRRYAKKVKHPGTPPVPFFGISQKCAREIFAYLDRRLDDMIRKVR